MLVRLLRTHLRRYRWVLLGLLGLQGVQALAGLYLPYLNADVIETTISPNSDLQKAFALDVKAPGGAAYELKGTIRIPEADKDFKFEHKSRLSPVPGIPNQYH